MPASPEAAEVLVIGAGPAGLAVGACLARLGRRATLLERGPRVGWSWHRHYQALRLHTIREVSHLPHLPIPASAGRYPSRDDLIAYLEAYHRHFGLDVRTGAEVVRARREAGGWIVETAARVYRAPALVVAAGFSHVAVQPRLPEQAAFGGRVLHSSDYRSGEPFRGQRVLVVGLGNSGADIAVDLHRHGALAAVSVRGPVFAVPEELGGVNWRTLFRGVPDIARAVGRRAGGLGSLVATRASAELWAAIGRAHFGDLAAAGIALKSGAEVVQHWSSNRPPLVADPFFRLVRAGAIDVFPGVAALGARSVRFQDGRQRDFDAVILATGFRCAIDFLEDAAAYMNESGMPRAEGVPAAAPGLYFCGYRAELSIIARSAQRIAEDVAARPTAPSAQTAR